MTQSTELLPIVQADRERAAEVAWKSPRFLGELLAGEHDDCEAVQAFARHRIEHSTPDRNAVLREAADAMPCTAENPNEDDYQRGRFDGIMEYQRAIRALTTTPEPTEDRFLTAYVSQDGRTVGIEHEMVADWNEVRAAHVALRDRINERLAEEDSCPFKPEPTDPAGVSGAILKGVGKINGDGWKDTTKIGEVVFAWNTELPPPYSQGQFPRIGCEGWSASVDQYDFTIATSDDVPAILAALRPSPVLEVAKEALEEAVQSLEWWERNEPASFGNIERMRLQNARAALATIKEGEAR